MRHLLAGVALAALLAAGLPAAAQTRGAAQPNTPPAASQTPPASPGDADTMPSAGQSGASRAAEPATKAKGKHAAKSPGEAHRRISSSPDDNIAEDLNRQELARLQQDSTRTPGQSIGEAPAQPARRGTPPNP